MSDSIKEGTVGLRPPAPSALPEKPLGPSAASRIANAIPATSGETDSLAAKHAALAPEKLRVDFRPDEFDRVILQHGKRLIWRKAMLCPCIMPSTDQVRVDCVDCDGSGYIYLDPTEIQAHMASFSKNTRMYEKFGLWQSGEVSVTTHAAHRLGWRDSLEMVDDLMGFNELLKKNDRRGKRSVLPAGTDAARYRIASLTKVLVKTTTGILPLEIGYHVTLNEQGHIKWTQQGNEVAPNNAIISVHYDYHPVWIVTSHPHAQRSDINAYKQPGGRAIGLPLQAGAQLDFLAETQKILPTTGAC